MNPAARLSSAERTRLAAQERWTDGVDGACHDFWRILLPAYFGDPSRISAMRGDLCDAPADLPARLRLAASVRASLGDWDLTGALRSVVAPVLIIHGTADPDPIEGAQAWAAALPLARLATMQGVGHFPHVERPEEFLGEVDRFLDGV